MWDRDSIDHCRERLRRLLVDFAYERREVVLASGQRSDFYIDCRKVALLAEGHALIGRLFYDRICSLCPDVRGVGGLTLGADPLASATSLTSYLAHQTDSQRPVVEAFYVRKEAKGHGLGQFIERAATLRAGDKVVIVEDVVTSGGSSRLAVARAKDAGLVPVLVLALVDREEGGRQAIEADLPLTTLFRKGDFLA